MKNLCRYVLNTLTNKCKTWIAYKIKFDKEITDRKLIAVGIDSSHIKGNETGVRIF